MDMANNDYYDMYHEVLMIEGVQAEEARICIWIHGIRLRDRHYQNWLFIPSTDDVLSCVIHPKGFDLVDGIDFLDILASIIRRTGKRTL